ncbi:MAG: hypothetical protein C0597_05985 [Marinilabiliales bacterium]|nr:MAG: hypothetical protein C0597_05985 [Marinilabiliales bacterium]
MKTSIPILLTLSILFNFSINSFSQKNPLQKGLDAITKESVKAQLEFLSSDWMEGRATGSRGEFLAADYLASMLIYNSIEPAGDQEWTKPTRAERWNGTRSEEYTSYFQNIYMIKQLESTSSVSIYSKSHNQWTFFEENVDYSIYGSNSSMQLNSEIVFVGYGFIDEESGYNDFKGVDVKNKIIVRLSGYPGHKDTNSLGYKKFHREERYFSYYLSRKKDKIAEEKGAVAIIEIYDDLNPKDWFEEQKFKLTNDNERPQSPNYKHRLELPSDDLVVNPIKIFPTKKLVNTILKSQDINPDYFEKTTAYSLRPSSKILKGANLKIDYQVKTELLQARNVIGMIEGENKDEIVVIGAHYDHLGAANGFVWNGADDNASGTIGVWMLAKAFKAAGIKPKKTLVFAAWTGEEKGLLGSKYFADHPYGGKIDNIKLYLNFDMISKDSEDDTLKNQARMTYSSSLSELEELTTKNIGDYSLNLDLSFRSSHNPKGGSDHSSFSAKNIPIMYFMAGFPITYHTPKDQTSDINWNKMVDIIKLSYLNLWQIVNDD